MQSFLGLCNYYRQFVDKYSYLTVQLGHLLNKDNRWRWNLKEQNIFELIKNKFLNTVILAHPNFSEPFYIHTDASDIALGVELFQLDGSDNHKVVAVSYTHLDVYKRQ